MEINAKGFSILYVGFATYSPKGNAFPCFPACNRIENVSVFCPLGVINRIPLQHKITLAYMKA